MLGPMIKGEKPYDQAAVDKALTQLEDTAKKLPTMFPESIKGLKVEGDFSASPKIWEDKAGFEAQDRRLRQGRDRGQGEDQGSGLAEGELPRDRQGMRRLPRDIPRQERLIASDANEKRADA